MKLHCLNVIWQIEDHIVDLTAETEDQVKLSEEVISFLLKELEQLKKYVLEKGFRNREEEVYFFRDLKPRIVSKLIYYNGIFKIETRKPNGGERIIRKYYHKELNKLKQYFDNNLDFYKYYRTGSAYLDYRYFVRKKHDIKLNLDSFYFEADHRFTTSHDFKVAKIIAHDQIQVYLENELNNLHIPERKSQVIHKAGLNWTASKVALVELIYALYASGAFNNNNADIKLIANEFEKVFNIKLGDYYRNFLAIRIRKKGRTQFLEKMQENLIRYMDSYDE